MSRRAGRHGRLLVIGVVIGLAAFTVPVTASGAPAGPVDPRSRMDGLRRPVVDEGAPVPEEQSRGKRGADSRVLTETTATTSTATSLAGATGVEPTAERVVGTLDVAGGETSVTDSSATTTAKVTDRSWQRRAGTNRYATAVALSKAGFENGAPVAFLATGEAFPDGLAASATAGTLGGPVLLARKTSLDSGTLAEFVRLNPATTYVAGGTSVVSDAEVAQLKGAVPGMTVIRVAGSDRTATAAALARLLPPQSKAAFVATGSDFPDGLSAAPAAARLSAPLLLSGSTSLSLAAQQELARLRPATTYVLGGTTVISDAVVKQIKQATGGAVLRLAGADRYPDRGGRLGPVLLGPRRAPHRRHGGRLPRRAGGGGSGCAARRSPPPRVGGQPAAPRDPRRGETDLLVRPGAPASHPLRRHRSPR